MTHVGWLRAVAAVALLMAAASPGSAELTPRQTEQARALIAQFTAPEFAARQQAVDKLVAMGPDVIPLVWKALAETKDAEVKLRCEMALKGIGDRFGVTPEGLEADRRLRLPSSRVTIDARDQTVRKVLESLAEQSGNRSPVTREPAILDRRVTLLVKDVPYWEGLDRLCGAAGLSYQLYTDRVDLRAKREGEEDVGAYAGPFVVKLYECRRSCLTTTTRTTRPFVNEPPAKTESDPKVELCFVYAFEDRLPSVVDGVRLVSVRYSDETELPAPPTGADRVAPAERLRQGYGRAQVGWRDPAPQRKGSVTVAGVAEIDLALGSKELRVSDLFAAEQKAVSAGGLTLLVKGVTRDPRGVTVAMEAERDVTVHVLHHTHGKGEYGFALVSPSGKRYDRVRAHHITGERMSNQIAEAGVDLPFHVAAWTLGRPGETETFTMKLGFAGAEAEPGAWALVYDYPERLERRSYPFTIRDIPLP